MESKNVLIGISIVVIVAVAGFWFIFGGTKPPVDVYVKSTPSSTADPESLLPTSVVGNSRTDLETNTYAYCVDAIGTYERNVRIEITRFNYVSDASDYVDLLYEELSGSKKHKINTGKVHWCTVKGSERCFFIWRKGIWIFEVSAPTESLRNEVIEGLNY
jgi:hypothetical protein